MNRGETPRWVVNLVVSLLHKLAPWQDIWNCCLGNKFHAIYPVVGTAQHNKIRSRREAVIINRLRLGHCRLTHI